MKSILIAFTATIVVFYSLCLLDHNLTSAATVEKANITKRLAKPSHHHDHHSMMHNHLSRKVFDRACAASKDTIDEIIACLMGNEHITKTVNGDTASGCYKEAFGQDFDAKDVTKHKDLICNNREKFEQMTACVYRKTIEVMDQKEIEKLTEAFVDVGLCIINALDG